VQGGMDCGKRLALAPLLPWACPAIPPCPTPTCQSLRKGVRSCPSESGASFCTPSFASLALAPICAAADQLRLNQRAEVGDGVELEPGTYRIEVERTRNSAEVLFFQGEDLVAAVHATLRKEDVKSKRMEIRSEEIDGERVITKIWLRGRKESLVFQRNATGAE